ncbi:MAG TPA: Uma2 family endonuclease [Nocardioidaceae bacterium]|nr:Uma2 family endonuclease [Nocardioidaceae bacterium]
MGVVTTSSEQVSGFPLVLPRGRPLVHADLEATPDDGHRYELVDGTLIVSPAPRRLHQRAVVQLVMLLSEGCPDHLEVLVAPFDVTLAEDTVLQPDVLVCRRADLSDRDLPAAPVLAVEVLSPSTRRIDLTLKRSRFEAAGCQSYWAVDPDEPSITAWQLHKGEYVEVAHVTGEDTLSISDPYPVTIRPNELVR